MTGDDVSAAQTVRGLVQTERTDICDHSQLAGQHAGHDAWLPLHLPCPHCQADPQSPLHSNWSVELTSALFFCLPFPTSFEAVIFSLNNWSVLGFLFTFLVVSRV